MEDGKPAKSVSAGAAAELVASGDWVDYGFGLGQPDVFDQALAARAPELSRVRIRSALTVRPVSYTHLDVYKRQIVATARS